MDQNLYELGRYKKKVADCMKQEQQLKSQLAFKDMLLESAMLYIVHFAAKGQTLPVEYECNYAELREQMKNYQVEFTPIEDKGMKLCIKEADQSTATEK